MVNGQAAYKLLEPFIAVMNEASGYNPDHEITLATFLLTALASQAYNESKLWYCLGNRSSNKLKTRLCYQPRQDNTATNTQ
ncbi:hypothetical protein GCM10025791_41050 [Halioxenophilus aromaticivorans]|uniref:Uncharacterized protein n=1 Tax=Halioxenophilus aromaticivorans TaxID=1306992 RepID=A0AAV3U824_9ALTE